MMEIFNHPQLRKYQRTCPAGFAILTEGDRADLLYILIEGSLDVIKGGKKIHEINQPGSFFGELSFLLGTVPIASIISATEDTRILCLPNAEVERLWQQFPEFARQLARNLAKRLHETTTVAQGFREFCDRMPDAVIMTNADHTVLSWNRAAEKLYGRSWHQMSGNSIEEIYDNQAAFKQFMAELESKEAIREKSLKINHPEKEWFFVSTSTTVLRDPQGHIQGYLFLGRDVTSVRKLKKKHRLVSKWLLPALLLLSLLTGGLCWQRFFPPPQANLLSREKTDQPRLASLLGRDSTALELALTPALTDNSPDKARGILAEYFKLFHPEFYGVAGIMLIGTDNRIFCEYNPLSPDNTELTGQLYQGVGFSEDSGSNPGGAMRIFMVSRPGAAGGQGVEVLSPLTNLPGRLAFHLKPGFIEEKFGSINNLAKAFSREGKDIYLNP